MSARAFRGKFNVGFALFKHTDHGEISVNTAYRLAYDAAALITEQIKLYSAPPQLLNDLRGTVARPFLGAGRCKINIRRGRIAFSK